MPLAPDPSRVSFVTISGFWLAFSLSPGFRRPVERGENREADADAARHVLLSGLSRVGLAHSLSTLLHLVPLPPASTPAAPILAASPRRSLDLDDLDARAPKTSASVSSSACRRPPHLPLLPRILAVCLVPALGLLPPAVSRRAGAPSW